jgi:hypothetical protein
MRMPRSRTLSPICLLSEAELSRPERKTTLTISSLAVSVPYVNLGLSLSPDQSKAMPLLWYLKRSSSMEIPPTSQQRIDTNDQL